MAKKRRSKPLSSRHRPSSSLATSASFAASAVLDNEMNRNMKTETEIKVEDKSFCGRGIGEGSNDSDSRKVGLFEMKVADDGSSENTSLDKTERNKKQIENGVECWKALVSNEDRNNDTESMERDDISEANLESLLHRLISEPQEDEVPQELSMELRGPPEQQTALRFWERRVIDIFTISILALKLYRYLFVGIMWYINFLRLLAFVLLLLPGFFQMIVFYIASPRLLRSVPYHSKIKEVPRNRLDVYLPRRKFRKKGSVPVIIYVTGGAWTIGYKAWGALFARRMSQRGVLVFCLDYRNFPQGTIREMLADINRGIVWVINNAFRYGGDPDNIFLVGQSAGGHLTSLALLSQAIRENSGNFGFQGDTPSWSPASIRAFVGVSGAYNLLELAEHLHQRGMYRDMFHAIMAGPDGSPRLEECSPELVARKLTEDEASFLPKILLLHGSGDRSVPIGNAQAFCEALRMAGADCELKIYLNKTHTQPIVEDPMRGGRDEMMDDVLSLIVGKPCFNRQFPMLPNIFINLASWVCPF